MDQPRPGKARQPHQVDVAFVETVMPGDIAGQHSRIGRFDIAGDEGDAHPGHRPHAEALQHMDMGMPAADQNEILSNRDTLLHRRHYAQVPSATPVVREEEMQIGFNLPISGPLSSPESVTRIARQGEALGYDLFDVERPRRAAERCGCRATLTPRAANSSGRARNAGSSS